MAPKVTIVVFGDIGRSPRMQYHATSFLKEGFKVEIIGYGGSKPDDYLTSHKNCRVKYLPQVPQFTKGKLTHYQELRLEVIGCSYLNLHFKRFKLIS